MYACLYYGCRCSRAQNISANFYSPKHDPRHYITYYYYRRTHRASYNLASGCTGRLSWMNTDVPPDMCFADMIMKKITKNKKTKTDSVKWYPAKQTWSSTKALRTYRRKTIVGKRTGRARFRPLAVSVEGVIITLYTRACTACTRDLFFIIIFSILSQQQLLDSSNV